MMETFLIRKVEDGSSKLSVTKMGGEPWGKKDNGRSVRATNVHACGSYEASWTHAKGEKG